MERKYVGVRICRVVSGFGWDVQGQLVSSDEWFTLRTHPVDCPVSRELALQDACVFAEEFSKHSNQLVKVYDDTEHCVRSYLKGTIHA